MGSNCGCGHRGCINSDNDKTPEEKVEELKRAIRELGFKVEETEEGIKISE